MNSARRAVRMPTAPKMASPTSETTQQFSSRWSETMRMSVLHGSGSVSSDFVQGFEDRREGCGWLNAFCA